MGSFPALMIRPPESAVQEVGGALQIKNEIQKSQLGEIQLEEAKLNRDSQQTLMESFARNNGDLNQTYADAAKSGKVTPKMLLDFRTSSIAQQTAMANLSEKQLENLGKTHDLAANALEAVKQVPEAERQVAIQRQLKSLSDQGVDISKIVPALQGMPDYSDKSLNQVETSFKGEQWLLNNEKAEREKEQAPSTPEVIEERRAKLAETIAQTNKAVADTSEALEKTRQMGKITDLETYKQQQENYRAALSRQSTFANALQKNGLEQLDKMFSDPQHGYVQFLGQANNTLSGIMQARNGSELAASLEATMLALGLSSFAGIHRVSPTEAAAAGPQVGSAARKLNALLDKVGTGSVPEDTLKEAESLVQGMIDSRHNATIAGANMVVANAGLDPKKTMVMDRSGVITTLDKAGVNASKPASGTAPVGATMKVPGSDGKLHWSDGRKDLGVAE